MLSPASIAVVGASERPGSYGGEALLNLARLGYPGRTFAVNPGRAVVHGVRSYPALEDLPEAPDAVVVAIPAGDAPDVVARASAMGCGGAVVFAAGFAEAREGELQAALTLAADGLPVCGPNGNGIVSLPDRVALWGDTIEPREAGPVALISQSGNVAVNALASRRGLGLHTVVSCGNQAVLGAADFLEALVERDGVRSVALYLEADGDGAQWCAVLERCAAAGIGVAVLKAGRSRAGAAAAEAHTGALAGDQRVFRALFEEMGALWAEDPHDLLEMAKALAMRRRRETVGGRGEAVGGGVLAVPRGVAVMTCSGGDSAVAADLAAELGVHLPALAPATIARLEAVLPAAATAANPLDYTSLLWDEPDKLQALIAALADDPGVGRVLVLYDEAGAGDESGSWAAVLEAVREAAKTADVTVASTLPELVSDGAIAGLRSGLRCMRATRAPRALADAGGRRPDDRRGRGQGPAARGRDRRRARARHRRRRGHLARAQRARGDQAARRDPQGSRRRRRAGRERRGHRARRGTTARAAHARRADGAARGRGARRDPPGRARPGPRRRRRRGPHRGAGRRRRRSRSPPTSSGSPRPSRRSGPRFRPTRSRALPSRSNSFRSP